MIFNTLEELKLLIKMMRSMDGTPFYEITDGNNEWRGSGWVFVEYIITRVGNDVSGEIHLVEKKEEEEVTKGLWDYENVG